MLSSQVNATRFFAEVFVAASNFYLTKFYFIFSKSLRNTNENLPSFVVIKTR